MDDASEKKPWWNDGDAVAGLCATVMLLLIIAVVIVLVGKLCIWLITGEWTL